MPSPGLGCQFIIKHLHLPLQIRDLNSGTFGFVELALDKTTGQQVAVKFIERGDKVLSCTALCCSSGSLLSASVMSIIPSTVDHSPIVDIEVELLRFIVLRIDVLP